MIFQGLKSLTLLAIALFAVFFSSCKKETSPTTGWDYNQPGEDFFKVTQFNEQATGPNLVFIEGGTFVMGRNQDDVMHDWNNISRRVTVSSFFMDETEIRNLDYLEYLHWTKRVFVVNGTEELSRIYFDALPDTLVWRDPLAYNEPYVQYYLRHPAYRDYPVVGVSWLQASNYAKWRTDRVNESILIRQGVLQEPSFDPNNFYTDEAVLTGQYDSEVRTSWLRRGEARPLNMEDGYILPRYRLPTEAEWEFAALGLKGSTIEERILEGRVYPWPGSTIRNSDRRSRGVFMANVQRGRGDMMGVAGNLNDAGEITVPVYSYWPNDLGLYNMAGNVNEWVQDVYRPLSHEDVAGFRPFRGNVFQNTVIGENGHALLDENRRFVTQPDTSLRRNYSRPDYIGYLDGDSLSMLPYSRQDEMYVYGQTSLISDEVRVYKGGSWKDRIYWINPGTRRFLHQEAATNDIGFRCAMDRIGSPTGHR